MEEAYSFKFCFELDKLHHPSIPKLDGGVYQGLVHTVAETVTADIVDMNGQRFKRRFLLDSGGAMTLFSIYSLPESGTFNIEDISHDPLKVSGVFEGVQRKADKWIRLKIVPCEDLGFTDNQFEIELDTYLVYEKEFPEIKRELPKEIKERIQGLPYNLRFSDSVILEDGNAIIKCDGIIGQCYRNAFGLRRIYEFSDRLVIKRTPFGDVLSGPTHIINKNSHRIYTEATCFEKGIQRFYKTRILTDEDFKQRFKPQIGSGYVPLALKPSGKCLGSEDLVKISTSELNRLTRDYLKKELDEFGDLGLSKAEYNQQVLKDFIENIVCEKDGRISIILPWNARVDNISDNKRKSYSRLMFLESQFKENDAQRLFYTEAINELIKMGFLVEIPMSIIYDEKEKFVIIPHHAVVREHRETTKWRIVFAANEKEKGGYALNEALECGPNLLKVIAVVLMKIRRGKFMLTQDLQKCFFQLKLSDKNPVRLLIYWSDFNKEGKSKHQLLQFVRMPWGMNCSMFCILAAIIHHILLVSKESSPVEAERLKRMLDTMYVDDIIELADSEEDCVIAAAGNKEAFAKAAMNVTRTRSNSQLVRATYPKDACTPDGNLVTKQGVLGMNWDMEDDSLLVNFDRIDSDTWKLPFTKRKALGMQAKFYDPLDLFSPYYFQFKLLYQQIESDDKLKWDTVLSEEIFQRWLDKFKEHVELKDIRFPRNIIPWAGDFEVAIFCDASDVGYGACAYIIKPGLSELLRAISRVVPKKEQDDNKRKSKEGRKKKSSSHRELHAAALSIKIREQIMEAYTERTIQFYHFCDNITALCWIQNPTLHTEIYVANRTEKIWKGSQPDEWRHVPGKENPADLASRGCSAKDLSKSQLWFHGPKWLMDNNKDKWPIKREITVEEAPEALEAVRQIVTVHRTFSMEDSTVDQFFKGIRFEDRRFGTLSEVIIILARLIGDLTQSGPLWDVFQKYKDNRFPPEEVNRVDDQFDDWITRLKERSIVNWKSSDRQWPGKDLGNPELTFSSRITQMMEDKPPKLWSAFQPKERISARNLLLRQTQRHQFPNLVNDVGGVIRRDHLNSMEKRLQDRYIIICDADTGLLMLSGRVPVPSMEETDEQHLRRTRKSLNRMITRKQARMEKEKEIESIEDDMDWIIETTENVNDDEPVNISFKPDDDDDDHDTIDDLVYEEDTSYFPVDRPEYLRNIPLEALKELGESFDFDGLKPVILLQGKGIVAESILRDAHIKSGHGGPEKTKRFCIETYWIDRLTEAYNRIRKTCQYCKYLRSKLLVVSEGGLPKFRTRVTRPFEIVGIDTAGPLYVSYHRHKPGPKSEKEKKDKQLATSGAFVKKHLHLMIITCCSTRAVNLQICRNLSTSEIARAFKEFTKERGTPKLVISDNAKSFKNLGLLYQEAFRQEISGACPEMSWRTIPSRAPWWGGFYESLLRPIKETARTILPRMRITDALHAHRMFKEIEYCLNSRPLYAVRNSDHQIIAVTPFQFLSVEPISQLYTGEGSQPDAEILLRTRTCQVRCLERLWKEMKTAYMTTLQRFHEARKTYEQSAPMVGDIVLLKRDMAARSFWPIARITKVFIGDKGKIRSVMVDVYAPNEINPKLAFEKFGTTQSARLTKAQRRELTGYFKPLVEPQAVRNLVPFEIWKSDAYQHMDSGAIINRFVKRSSLLKGLDIEFDDFSYPDVPTINMEMQNYSRMDESWQTTATELLHCFNAPVEDHDRFDHAKIRMELGL